MVVTEHTEQHGKQYPTAAPLPLLSRTEKCFCTLKLLLAARQIAALTYLKLRGVQQISTEGNNGNVVARNVTIPQPNIWPKSLLTKYTKPKSICSL